MRAELLHLSNYQVSEGFAEPPDLHPNEWQHWPEWADSWERTHMLSFFFFPFFPLQTACPGLMKFKVVSGFRLHQNGLEMAEWLQDRMYDKGWQTPCYSWRCWPGQGLGVRRQIYLPVSITYSKIDKMGERGEGKWQRTRTWAVVSGSSHNYHFVTHH